MSNIHFINKEELGLSDDGLARFVTVSLNCRFMGFLAALAERRDLSLPGLLTDAAEIMAQADVAQPKGLWWKEEEKLISSVMSASERLDKYPCQYNVGLLQGEISKLCHWYLFHDLGDE